MQSSLSAGVTLQNRYRLLGILGQGGFGRTYLGEDLGRFHERCAIKEFIPPQGGENALAKARELFRREAETLYQISHPQVPQFRATFEENQRLFIVQDYVAGKTYRDLLNDRKEQGMVFSEAEGRQLLQQLLPVLAHLHAKGIIHRDIAPDNIILRQSDYLPVLIDFGVVKAIATQMYLQGTAHSSVTTVGKLGYAPPEQMQTGRAYPNSDLYALAVSVVVLMTGKEPQELYDDMSSTWHWQRYAQVNPQFAAVLNRMLSYRPSDRFSSVSEVVQALQGNTPAAAPPGHPVPPPYAPPTVPQHTVPPLPPPAAAAPDVSQMQTVAVGRRAVPNPTGMQPSRAPGRGYASTQQAAPLPPSQRNQSSLWDNPLAVLGLGLGLAIVTGIASWAVVSALMNSQGPMPQPTPTVEPSPTATATPSSSPSPSPTPNQPVVFDQRINLNAGAQTTLRGSLRTNQTINYIVALEEGDTLAANLEGRDVVMTVLLPNDQPFNPNSVDVVRWEGEAPVSGDYVVSLETVGDSEQVDYALTLRRAAVEPSPLPEPEPEPEPDVNTQSLNLAPGESMEVTDQVRRDRIQRYLVALSPGQVLRVERLQGDVQLTLREPAGPPTGQVSDGLAVVEAATEGRYQIDVSGNQVVNFALRVSVE